MDDKETLKTGYLLCHLLRLALQDEKTPESLTTDQISTMFALSKEHGLAMLVSKAIPNLPLYWKTHIQHLIIQRMQMDFERGELFEFLREQEIWYMPMKGLTFMKLYPEETDREMCDNDILYDPAGYKKVKQWFLEREYETEYNSVHAHVESYIQEPYCHFEMHRRFFEAGHREWVAYYSDIEKRLIHVDEFERRFSDEDFYVYTTLHGYKHYQDGGTGLRTLLDAYVFISNKQLNWNYVDEELHKLGIAQYEKEIRTLSEKLFTEQVLNKEEENLFLYILTSGAYGTQKHYLEKQFQEHSKQYLLWKAIFPGSGWVKNAVPFYKNHPYLIPFYYMYRLVSRGLKHPKEVKQKLMAIIRYKN